MDRPPDVETFVAVLVDDDGAELWRGRVYATDAGYVPVDRMLYVSWRRRIRWRRLPAGTTV